MKKKIELIGMELKVEEMYGTKKPPFNKMRALKYFK